MGIEIWEIDGNLEVGHGKWYNIQRTWVLEFMDMSSWIHYMSSWIHGYPNEKKMSVTKKVQKYETWV